MPPPWTTGQNTFGGPSAGRGRQAPNGRAKRQNTVERRKRGARGGGVTPKEGMREQKERGLSGSTNSLSTTTDMHVALTTCTTHSNAKATNTQPPSNAATIEREHRGQCRAECSASAPVSWPVAIPRSSFPGPSAHLLLAEGGNQTFAIPRCRQPARRCTQFCLSSTYFQVPDGALESAAVPLGTGRARAASSSPRKSLPTTRPPSGCQRCRVPLFPSMGSRWGPRTGPAPRFLLPPEFGRMGR